MTRRAVASGLAWWAVLVGLAVGASSLVSVLYGHESRAENSTASGLIFEGTQAEEDVIVELPGFLFYGDDGAPLIGAAPRCGCFVRYGGRVEWKDDGR